MQLRSFHKPKEKMDTQSKLKIQQLVKKPKRNRSVITLEEKIDIIRMHDEDSMTCTSIARATKRPLSTVHAIVKGKNRIKECVGRSHVLRTTCIITRRDVPMADMEKQLAQWIEDLNRKRIPITTSAIQRKAISLYNGIQIQDDEDDTNADPEGDFKASNGWFRKFRQRYDIITNNDSAKKDTSVEVKNFPAALEVIIQQGEYVPEQIFNVGECYLYWKRLPANYKNWSGDQNKVFIMVGGNASGDYKLTPITGNNNNRNITWINEIEAYCDKMALPFKALLLLDADSPNIENTNINNIHPNIQVVYFPRTRSKTLQPMYQGVIATFQAYYLREMLQQAVGASLNNTKTSVFWKNYKISDAVKNITSAWSQMSETTMNGAWREICPEMAPTIEPCSECTSLASSDVKNAAMVEYSQVAEACVRLAQHLTLEMDTNDINDLILSHDENVNVIVENVKDEPLDLDDTRPDVEVEPEMVLLDPSFMHVTFTKEGLAEVFGMIEGALAKLESMESNIERFEGVSGGIYQQMACYQKLYNDMLQGGGGNDGVGVHDVGSVKLEPL